MKVEVIGVVTMKKRTGIDQTKLQTVAPKGDCVFEAIDCWSPWNREVKRDRKHLPIWELKVNGALTPHF
jgi:hypothetical protein